MNTIKFIYNLFVLIQTPPYGRGDSFHGHKKEELKSWSPQATNFLIPLKPLPIVAMSSRRRRDQYLNYFLFFLLYFFSTTFTLYAQHKCLPPKPLNRTYEFIENNNQWPSLILYKVDLSGSAIFLEKDGFTFHFVQTNESKHNHDHKGSSEKDSIKKFHAYKVKFKNCNTNALISGKYATIDYNNYFTGKDQRTWASHVKKYKQIEYKNIYPNIDLLVYSKGDDFKYDFIVHPGGDPKQIQLVYDGIDEMHISDERLILKTSINEIVENAPYAYEQLNKKEVTCSYKLTDSTLSFNTPKYNKSQTLVIDPGLVFSTYSGSTADNWGFTATYDKEGNVYAGGIAEGVGYPVTTGAFQTSPADMDTYFILWNGNWYIGYNEWDMAIIKYDTSGTKRIFATYLGGISSDLPHSIITNSKDELIIMGTTGSPNYPVTKTAYDTTFNGGTGLTYDNVLDFQRGIDICISHLSKGGDSLLGSTFIGGSNNDGLNYRKYYEPYLSYGTDSLYYNYGDGARGEVALDSNDNIYIGTCTFSSDFPASAAPAQALSKGRQDGVVCKLTPKLDTLLWSSYLGGSMDDAIYSIDVRPDKSVYLTGGTNSSDFPKTIGAFKTSYQGGTADAFITHLSANGSSILQSTYFGSPAYDQAYFVRCNNDGDVFIYGQTKATGTSLIYNAQYNKPNSGQFIARFPYDLSTWKWSTVFGTSNGKPNISPTAFSVDVCNRVYLSGCGREWVGDDPTFQWGNTFGTVGMDITSKAVQKTTDGQDFYLMVMSDDANMLQYATFFGEQHIATEGQSGRDHVDGGTSRFDRLGNIYQSVCASCGGGSYDRFPTTLGAWSQTNNAQNCNNAVFKFNVNFTPILADFDPPALSCAPSLITFTNKSSGTNFTWDFGDGSPLSNQQYPTHLYKKSGVYTIKLIADDTLACNYADTVYKKFKINKYETIQLPDTTICTGDDVVVGITPFTDTTHIYQWTPNTNVDKENESVTLIKPPNNTNDYILTANDGVCIDSIFQRIKTIDILKGFAGIDQKACKNNILTYTGTAPDNNFRFVWSSNNAFTDTLNASLTTPSIQVKATANSSYYLNIFYLGCNQTDSVFMQVSDPKLLLDSLVHVKCFNENSGLIIVHVENGVMPYSYKWSNSTTSNSNLNLKIGIYQITYSDSLACTKDSAFTILQPNKLTNTISGTINTCHKPCNAEVTNITEGGAPPYTYTWNTIDSTAIVKNLCESKYQVTVSDTNNCNLKDSITITGSVLTLILDSIEHVKCFEENNGKLIVHTDKGQSPYSYQWSNSSVSNSNRNLVAQLYVVTYSDLNGCKHDTSFIITQPDKLQNNIQSKVNTCKNACNGEATSIAFGGTSPYSYLWQTNSINTTIKSLCEGLYRIQIADAHNCKLNDSINIGTSFPQILADTVNDVNCFDEANGRIVVHPINGVPPYTYNWSNNATSNKNLNLKAGTYTLTYTDAILCINETSFTVKHPDKLTDTIIGKLNNCVTPCNGIAVVTANGGTPPYSYLWNSNNTTPIENKLCAGTYHVQITDAHNCNVHDTIILSDDILYLPLTTVASNYTIHESEITILSTTSYPDVKYVWTPTKPCFTPDNYETNARPLQSTTFKVTLFDTRGCIWEDTVTINVIDMICGEPNIFVPNAFTPNQDGHNDELKVRGIVVEHLYFAIYDRWGTKVFETTEQSKGWDGTLNGKLCNPGVFVYYLETTCYSEEKYTKKGNITLIR